MDKRKPINSEEILTYQKVPKMGNNWKMTIFGLIVIIGLMIYSMYFLKTKQTLVCKKNNTVKLTTTLSSEAIIKLSFKNDKYQSGTIKEIIALSTYNDINNILEEYSFCEMEINSSNLYTLKDCVQELDNENIVVNAKLILKDSEKVGIKDEKEFFEKEGYSCNIEK